MELRVQVKGETEKREKGREQEGDEREKLREREKTKKGGRNGGRTNCVGNEEKVVSNYYSPKA